MSTYDGRGGGDWQQQPQAWGRPQQPAFQYQQPLNDYEAQGEPHGGRPGDRTSAELREQARRIAEDIFSGSSLSDEVFTSDDLAFEQQQRQAPAQQAPRMWQRPPPQAQPPSAPEGPAPTRHGVGRSEVQPDIQGFDYEPEDDDDALPAPSQEPFRAPPRQAASLQRDQARRGDPVAPPRSNSVRERGPAAGAPQTLGDAPDRFAGYPAPGQLIPEAERPAPYQPPPNSSTLLAGSPPAQSQSAYPPPSMEDLEAVIFSGYLFKQNRRGQFQKRLFRFDGLLLICLSPKRLKLPDHLSLMTFNPAKHSEAGLGKEFVEALGRFYPTNPPMPALTNPLIASWGESRGEPDIYTRYYHMPKWIIPTGAILSIRSQGPDRDPESPASRTFAIETAGRSYLLRAPSAREFNRWTFLLSRMSAAGGDAPAAPRPSVDAVTFGLEEAPEGDDDGEDDLVAPEAPPAPNPRASLARMGDWRRSVADLIGRDAGAGDAVVSVGGGVSLTIERGLSRARGAPPAVPPVPTFEAHAVAVRQRSDSQGSTRSNQGRDGRGHYPMPVPLRPDQLQPPPGRVMRGPTIFGAAIAAGVKPTTPLMPGDVLPPKELLGGPSPSPDPSKRRDKNIPAGIRQMNRNSNRMSIISATGDAVPFIAPPRTHGSPPRRQPMTALAPAPAMPTLDPEALADLSRSLNGILRVLARLAGNDSPDPLTQPSAGPPAPPCRSFREGYVVAVGHFAGRAAGHLDAGRGARLKAAVGEFERSRGAAGDARVRAIVEEARLALGLH